MSTPPTPHARVQPRQVAFLAALEKRHLFSLQVLEDQGFNFCSERSELTLAQANLEDPQIRQFVEEARARRAEKDSAEVAQTLVEHLEETFAKARSGSQVVAEALMKHMDLLEEQTVRLARALAAQISFRDDPVAVTLAQQLLSNDPFQRNAAIALAQDLLGGGRDSRCSSARTAPLSSAGEVSVAASDEAEALANRVFAQLKDESSPAASRGATPEPTAEPPVPRGSALADFLLVSRALAEHVLARSASPASEGSTLASQLLSLCEDQMDVARALARHWELQAALPNAATGVPLGTGQPARGPSPGSATAVHSATTYRDASEPGDTEAYALTARLFSAGSDTYAEPTAEPEALESDPPPVPDDLEMEMQDTVKPKVTEGVTALLQDLEALDRRLDGDEAVEAAPHVRETPSPEIARDELELIVARVLAQHAACPSN
ncbi:unnamed protein product [Durusdinium trenchii]|uniref:Uncharacterized protein n=1 Tax=Durusdinium trenchii TaxID=1381693 RepID=A0ABP0N4F3_9DINO